MKQDVEQDTRVSCLQYETHHRSVERSQHGSCKTDVQQEWKADGLVRTGHCNGMLSSGLVKNGCDQRNGFQKNGYRKLVESGVTVNEYIESGCTSAVRRGRKVDSAGKESGRSSIDEVNNTGSDIQTVPQALQSHVAEHAESSPVKVSFHKLLSCWTCSDVLII